MLLKCGQKSPYRSVLPQLVDLINPSINRTAFYKTLLAFLPISVYFLAEGTQCFT